MGGSATRSRPWRERGSLRKRRQVMAGPAPVCLHGRTTRGAIGFGALSHVAMTAQSACSNRPS